MAEYIERKAAIDAIMKVYARTAEYKVRERVFEAEEAVYRLPVADVAPVVHGRWKLLHKGDWTSVFICSVCGRRETIAESEAYNSALKMPKKYPYCHCGARMDGDSDAKAD